MVAFLLLSSIAPLSAQNLVSTFRNSESSTSSDVLVSHGEQGFTSSATLSGKYEVPVLDKIKGELPNATPAYAAQDAATLDTRASSQQKVESVVDLGVLRNPSAYRKAVVNSSGKPYEIDANSLQNGLAMITAAYRESGKREKTADCLALSLSVEQRINLNASKVLEIVETEVGANPSCACEIVKTAIKASAADVQQVVAIVETAINASPDNMRLISQCAIASMPESITEVQALLAKLDPNTGDSGAYSSKGYSSKSAKSAKIASIDPPEVANPLDRPNLFPPTPPIIIPPVTRVNP
jgi:hypothetical protein